SASSRAVPAFPGATYTRATRGLCAIFHASACSRPPPPTTRIFMSMPEVANAGEQHREAAFVCGGDHFRVAHAAAGLNHGGGAVLGHHIEPVAKRKEGIGGNGGIRERKPGRRCLDRRNA